MTDEWTDINAVKIYAIAESFLKAVRFKSIHIGTTYFFYLVFFSLSRVFLLFRWFCIIHVKCLTNFPPIMLSIFFLVLTTHRYITASTVSPKSWVAIAARNSRPSRTVAIVFCGCTFIRTKTSNTRASRPSTNLFRDPHQVCLCLCLYVGKKSDHYISLCRHFSDCGRFTVSLRARRIRGLCHQYGHRCGAYQ